MKKIKSFSFIFSLAVLLALLATACTKQDQNEIKESKESAISLLKTVEDIKVLALDAKFNLSSEVYSSFLNSLVFKDKQLRGFYYEDMIKNMSNQEQEEFWAYFGITIELGEDTDDESEAVYREVNPPVLSDAICIAFNATPLYCWYAPGYICMYIC